MKTQKHAPVTNQSALNRDWTFAAAGPQVWNSLLPNLRLCGLSYGQFRQLLKTLLFGQRGHGAV